MWPSVGVPGHSFGGGAGHVAGGISVSQSRMWAQSLGSSINQKDLGHLTLVAGVKETV